ncbi:hypothetical protein ACFWZ0_13900 [[Kitasatospora] papulosa]|uniref:hypothetical protein n=1 Tax=[Kitasatospora] papulosa TaxID=1464011 RepID=UPI0036966906
MRAAIFRRRRQGEIKAAGVLLANLPGRWACGAEDIAKYARLLAESAKRWGRPLGEELEARLTDMTGTSQKIRGQYPRVIQARLRSHLIWRVCGSR